MVCNCVKTTGNPLIHIPGCLFKVKDAPAVAGCCCFEVKTNQTDHKQGCPFSTFCSSCGYSFFLCKMMKKCIGDPPHISIQKAAVLSSRKTYLLGVYGLVVKPRILDLHKKGGIHKGSNLELVKIKNDFKKILEKENLSTNDLIKAEALLLKLRVGYKACKAMHERQQCDAVDFMPMRED